MSSKNQLKAPSLWTPLPPIPGKRFSSQQFFLSSGMNKENYIREVLYHGTRGVGKTEALLMAFAMHVGKGYSQWRGVVFRKEYKALDDVIKKSKKLFPKIFGDKCKFLEAKADYKWIFYTSYGTEELLFRAIDSVADYDDKFHGQEFQFIGWEELCSWKDLNIYYTMMSCLRCSSDDLEVNNKPPLLVRATTNPYGAGRSAVKRAFIDQAKSGKPFDIKVEVDDEVFTSQRMHVFGSWKENIYLNSDYPLSFAGLKETDMNKYRAFLYGDWEAVSGGMYGDIWNYNDHVIKPFELPEHIYIDRSYDHGTASPFSTLWFGELDGLTEITKLDGSKVTPPRGSIIVIDELYGAKNLEEPNKGLNLNPTKIAELIINKENKMKGSVISLFSKINKGPADNAIWNDSKVRGLKTVADLMEEKKVFWSRSNKAKGSRYTRIQYIKEMLSAAKNEDFSMPWLLVFDHCKFLINNLPALQISDSDPDDTDPQGIDHDHDALGYKIINKKSGKTIIKNGF